MSSRIITPPDKFLTARSYLIINAIDTEIDTLVLWLKTVPETYDIHLWHVQMPDTEMWLYQVINGVQHVLINKKFEQYIPPNSQRILNKKQQQSYFGPETENTEVIHWFLRNRLVNI